MNDTRTPNGGWQFLQAQTKWKLDRTTKPSSISVTLDQAAELLQKHRMQNPQFNLPTAFSDVREEIINYNRVRLGIPDPPGPKLEPQHAKGAAGVAGHLGKTASGIKLLTQWLGDGLNPVPRQLAEKRAQVCATCPQNQEGNLWQRMDALAAHELRSLISAKKNMKLETQKDYALKTCQACDCWLPLKVWAKLHHILDNTSPEVREALDVSCWVTAEEQSVG
jgi:hypothetical protein